MLLWTIGELMHLTRDELCNLDGNLRHALAEFEAGTCERYAVLTTLNNIRRAMGRRGLHY
ncbi:hypothetical protein [Bradyrhizobium sp. Ec3.3]|uniref:hypothetical protein n=1 Tax=Bradyrhizobium sp. Ec3.3 TaxID=189753 RepID=UPI0004099EED|nr:hypothetical protein [Bradyrhizobium sp. Ec3.3]